MSPQRTAHHHSKSSVPCTDRPRNRDLSGVRHQLHIRNLSTQSLGGLEQIQSRRNVTNTTGIPARGLTKSKTATSLASRILTPRLLGPLSPSLPRTQTITGLSCTGTPASTPSPTKSTTSSTSPLGKDRVDIADALAESRMTVEEIAYRNQVEWEKDENRRAPRYHTAQLSHSLSSFTRSSMSTSSGLNLSANDVANTTRLEYQRRHIHGAGGRPLHIDPILTQSEATSLAEDEWAFNLKQVGAMIGRTA